MTTEKPAADYNRRVRRLLDVMLGHVRAAVGPRYREPSPEQIERMVAVFHRVMNQWLDMAARLGYQVEGYFSNPLTEGQLRSIEKVLLRGKPDNRPRVTT